MTMFTYNSGVPFSTNNPSNDQPQMLINTVSNNGIWNVDHVGFNSTGIIGNPQASGGQHLQVTFNGKHVPGGTITDPLSILYTNNITGAGAFNTASASTISQLFFLNQSGGATTPISPFPVSMIKAFGCFDSAGNSLNAWNITLLSPGGQPSAGNYIFVMPVGCCNSLNYLVIVTPTASTSGGKSQVGVAYSIVSAAQFNVQFGISGVGFFNPDQFSIIVMQL